MRKNQQIVPLSVSATTRCQPQGLDLGLGEVVFRPLMGIDRAVGTHCSGLSCDLRPSAISIDS